MPIEYEVIADSNFIGELTYGSVNLQIWDFGFHRRGEKRLLCLRFEEEVELPPFPPKKAQEFVYLSSLFLRRRLVLGKMTRFNNTPRRHSSAWRQSNDEFVNADIVRGETNLSELSDWLLLMEHLDTEKRNRFCLAAKFYSEALEHIEANPDIAYLNLVSVIETLCRDVEIGEVVLTEIDRGIANAVNKIQPPDIQEEVAKSIIKHERFIKRKFIKFIIGYTAEGFWAYQRRPPEPLRVNPSDLDRLMANIYDQRSRTLHAGEPFPSYIFECHRLPGLEIYPEDTYLNKNVKIGYLPMAEVPTGKAISSGGRIWKSKDYIPYPHFFERLVNHVLKCYLKKHQV